MRESGANAEALEILSYVLTWRLQSARWAEAEKIIGALANAVAAGDTVAMTIETTNLELLGPLRVIPIGQPGQPELVPPPDPVRERVYQLVHVLGNPVRPDAVQADVPRLPQDQA